MVVLHTSKRVPEDFMLHLFSPSTLKLSYLTVVQNKGYVALLSIDQLQG